MERSLIVGCGAMGRGIAYIMAKYLKDTIICVIEPNTSIVNHAKKTILHWQDKDITKGEIASPCIKKIQFYSNFSSLNFDKFDLLIEAAPENIGVKKQIFSEFNKISDSKTIIASNTSSLSITQMATEISLEKRHQVIGLHFFNPPKIMKLLEIIVSELTSDETIKKAKKIGEMLHKIIVVCKDAPGFITSRIGIVSVNEAIFILQEGLSSIEDIDQAMKLGYRHPMGPLKLADLIGLDIVFAVTQSLYENYQDSKYRPSLLLRKKVEANHLGIKTGQGFYKYPLNS